MNVPEDRRAPTEKELKEKLSSFEYHVLRDGGTERAFTGEYWDCHRKGIYECRACGNPLFSSDTKYDSGTGWPSFYAPIGEDAIKTEVDQSLGMVRTEARCSVVYHATAKIQQGKVTTYGELAKALNSAPRAVGQALKRNPFNDDSFIPRVPCHRVISQDFTLGGFSGKTDPSSSQIQKKLQLLESEGFEFRDFKLIESMQERVLRYNDLKNLR
eukprot:jgi/Galph1/3710/GphlegSOOS_G2372.1